MMGKEKREKYLTKRKKKDRIREKSEHKFEREKEYGTG